MANIASFSFSISEELQRLLGRAEKDDIIICTKMDRLGCNTTDMIHIIDACYKKGIAIRLLENGLSTEDTMGKMGDPWLQRQSVFWIKPMTGGLPQWSPVFRFGRKPHTAIAPDLILSLSFRYDSKKETSPAFQI